MKLDIMTHFVHRFIMREDQTGRFGAVLSGAKKITEIDRDFPDVSAEEVAGYYGAWSVQNNPGIGNFSPENAEVKEEMEGALKFQNVDSPKAREVANHILRRWAAYNDVMLGDLHFKADKYMRIEVLCNGEKVAEIWPAGEPTQYNVTRAEVWGNGSQQPMYVARMNNYYDDLDDVLIKAFAFAVDWFGNKQAAEDLNKFKESLDA